MITINPQWLPLIWEVLTPFLPPHAVVWAYGSRVHQHHLKPFSDLDLAVEYPKTENSMDLAGLRQAFSDSDIPIRVDVVDLNHCPPSFRETILAMRERLPLK